MIIAGARLRQKLRETEKKTAQCAKKARGRFHPINNYFMFGQSRLNIPIPLWNWCGDQTRKERAVV